jgi:hypothetical protein
LIDVPIDSPSEKIGNVKLFVAEATDIPIGDLRLGFHSDEQPLVDDFEVIVVSILAVETSDFLLRRVFKIAETLKNWGLL